MVAQISLPPSGGNQKSVVTQYIGPLVQVTVTYNSPDVTASNGDDRKGKIWGQLVPHGFTKQGFGLNNPSPWRAGANECTTIEFSHDVEVNGALISAGKYALFVATSEDGPWTVIFSKNDEGWGSYFYKEEEDVLRVTVTPKDGEYHEWLTYDFTDRKPDQTTLALKWEYKEVPFTIAVPNQNDLIVAQLQKELTGQQGFSWLNLNGAAAFCLQNNTHLEQGLAWAEQSINAPFGIGDANFTTLSTKAQLLALNGQEAEGAKVMDRAIKLPTTSVLQIHGYGRQVLNSGAKEKALDIFTYNMERFGDVWPVRVGMMRALSAMGKYDEALTHAKIAYERAPDQLNKNNLAAFMEKLKKKEDGN